MRNLAKGAVPPVLQQKEAEWLADFLNDQESPTKKFRYRHQEIKQALLHETRSKCVYCESKIGHNTPGDVEHKVPSTKNRQLHFAWTNLTIACTECNRRKTNYYVEGSEFLDPYADDVEYSLIHLGPLVHWRPGETRAEITIRKLELDSFARPALIERKRDHLVKVRALLDVATQQTLHPLLDALRRDEIRRLCESDAEYSAMTKAYVDCTASTVKPPTLPAPAEQHPV